MILRAIWWIIITRYGKEAGVETRNVTTDARVDV